MPPYRARSSGQVMAIRFAIVLLLWVVLAWMAARALIVTKKLEHADVLVVLSGSSTYLERSQWAAHLYHEGRASRIVLTNDGLQAGYSAARDGNPLFFELSEAELKQAGVATDRIEVIAKAGNSTYDEATYLRDYARQHNVTSLIIVTSAYHSRRALWVFENVFRDSGVTIGIESPPPGVQTPQPVSWWLHQLGWKLVPGEYLKLAYYAWRY